MKWFAFRDRGPTSYPQRVFWSYLPDWIITIALWGLFYLVDKIDGYRRLFDVNDTSLAHPYRLHERVPVWLLAVVTGLGPAIIIVLLAAMRRSFWDAHNGLLGLVLALGLSVTFTDVLKIAAGRPRPDLFGRCQLPESYQSNPVHGLTSWRECTETSLLKDGFRSFPSGHSSFAWTGMWYLVLYLAAKFRITNQRGYTIKSWTLLLPLCCASLISISRTMDYRHHATDVIAGAIIGILAGWWGYRQYYPPLAAPSSWRPYAPRIPPDEGPLPLHEMSTGGTAAGERVPLSGAGAVPGATPPGTVGTNHGHNVAFANNGNAQAYTSYPPPSHQASV
ncbi:uncharacterized protein EHS24_001715 [Apiotrichum porosum]|uniref:Phosphatidic acid phosphatase type 2/haloperoxidase domain-containing protein n=1 Tax=Apiotrichum porosum TaxID=105984 RepID=A0A427XIX4_9TREE|nr:uncharacterized protein EHS24_001715 [Apiotrichum porosum]RSH78806.1 hypothetical protein EHS24_001715 [Apiotrichum porosum]